MSTTSRSPTFVTLELVESKDKEVQTLALLVAAMDWADAGIAPVTPEAKARIAAWLAARHPTPPTHVMTPSGLEPARRT